MVLALEDLTWANAGCKACSTPQKVMKEAATHRKCQSANYWAFKAMVGLQPFSIVRQKKSCLPSRVYEVSVEAVWMAWVNEKIHGPLASLNE